MSRYLERLFDPVADRIADRVVGRLSVLIEELEAQIETLGVLSDPDAMADLRASAEEPDEAARPFAEVRRETRVARTST